jgi:hypothetical protein
MGSSKAALKREAEEAAAQAMAAALNARFAGVESRAEAIKGEKTAKVRTVISRNQHQTCLFEKARGWIYARNHLRYED